MEGMIGEARSSVAVGKATAAVCCDAGRGHRPLQGCVAARAQARVRAGCWATSTGPTVAGWAALAFFHCLLFPNPFLFPISILCYTLGSYACIHMLPSMYTSLWGPLGVN